MFVDLRVGNLSEPLTGRRWDGAAVMQQVLRRAAWYQQHGLQCGERVFAHHGNSLEFFADLLAVWSLGACLVPIDGRLTVFEVETLARAARPRLSLWLGSPESTLANALEMLGVRSLDTAEATFAGTARAEPAAFAHNLRLDQDALILFTSGTTGQPKGVVHTHRSLRARWISLQQSLGLSPFRRTLCLLPTHFGHGLICNCLFPWLAGQDLLILPPFRPELIVQLGTLLDEFGVTFMSSVPAVWRLASKMARPPQTGSLERVFCGSAPLSGSLWQGIREWTGTSEVFNAYGITETGSWLAGTTVGEFTPEDGLVGQPWGSVIRVLRSKDTTVAPALCEPAAACEAGYVWVNTPALMRGYLDRDDLTEQVVSQGWFFTGDVGLIDERGWLYLRGREREEINKGGMKVYPGDIDAVVERFPATLDVCAFGFEDPLYGENVGIAVVLEAGDEARLQELVEWTAYHLAKHQMPLRWYLLDEIPRTSRGKVNREHVATRCAALTPLDVCAVRGAGAD
jgi:acyl-CoA synthetase (AMP-forming)/AMP-acid ligase II